MKQKGNDVSKPKQIYSVRHSLVNYYLVLMLGFFPMFLTSQYTHARTDKYILFLILSAILVISTGGIMIAEKLSKTSLTQEKKLIAPLSVTDIMMICFFVFAFISTLLSPQRYAILTGDIARNNGIPLLLMYALVYFAITRNYVHKDYALCAFLGFSMIVAGLTVLNFYNIDPLGVYTGYGADTIADFGSTIGNKNMIAAFMCVYLPAAMMSFTVAENRILKIISGIAIGFAYGGLLCADSTSDIFGLVIIIPVMMIFSAGNLKHLRSYMLALTIMFASGKLLHLFAVIVGDNNKGFEFIQQYLIYSPIGYILSAVCAAVYLILRFFVKDGKYPAKAIRITLGVIFGLLGLSALGSLIYFSTADLNTDLGSFKKLLRFNDAWGTHRGFMWRMSLEEYSKLPFINKLFGSGPDTLYYVFQPHFEELNSRFGDATTDAAHNEFINYLVTQGALGLLAYLGLAVSAIVRGIKAARKNTVVFVFISVVICYLAQSVVNLYSPIVTPLFFIFLSLTEAVARNEQLVD